MATWLAILCWASWICVLFFKAHQNILRGTELLHSDVAKAERREGGADRVGLQGLRPAQLNQNAAAKIDPKI